MTQSNQNRLLRLENEKMELECCYSSMPACQQDRADARINKINEEITALQES